MSVSVLLEGKWMKSLWKTFYAACAETPRGYFAPGIALWRLFCETADGKAAPGSGQLDA